MKNFASQLPRRRIESVIKELPLNKTLGPNGMPAELYKRCWTTIKDDFIATMLHFFIANQLPPQWKSMFIARTLKVKSPSSARDVRLISLCNVCYKVVSKILVNRLRH